MLAFFVDRVGDVDFRRITEEVVSRRFANEGLKIKIPALSLQKAQGQLRGTRRKGLSKVLKAKS